MSYECYCDHCSGIAAPSEPAGPCGFPRPDVPGEICGGYEGHEGGHGWWFAPASIPSGGA